MSDDTIHTIPVNDLIEHDTTGDSVCICGPETVAVFHDDGSIAGWQVIHHSLDGREQYEDVREQYEKQRENRKQIWDWAVIGFLLSALVILSVFWGIIISITLIE